MLKDINPLEVAIKFSELQPFVGKMSYGALKIKIKNVFNLDLSVPEEVKALDTTFKTLYYEHNKQISHKKEKAKIQGQIDILQAKLKAMEIS